MMKKVLIKNYCEYLTFRSFYTGFPVDGSALPYVRDEDEAIERIKQIVANADNPALLLSSGMDSAVLLPFMPKNSSAYTVYYEGIDDSEVNLAKQYCDKFSIKHVPIAINPQAYLSAIDPLMLSKKMPLSPAEPLFYLATKRACQDGFNTVLTGGVADTRFGGFTRFRKPLKSADYQRKLHKKYHDPALVLKKTHNLNHVFDQYLLPMPKGKERALKYYSQQLFSRKRDRSTIDSRKFLQDVSIERFAFDNAITQAGCQHIAPFSTFLFDFDEHWNKQCPKYFIQRIYECIYGHKPPKKLALQKPTFLLNDYCPSNMDLFRNDLDMQAMKYSKKFLIFCLERFEALRLKGLIK